MAAECGKTFIEHIATFVLRKSSTDAPKEVTLRGGYWELELSAQVNRFVEDV
jgi:hypothetical protein